MGSMNTDLLQQLAPAHAPPPPSWWPPAPGWWLIALMLLAVPVAAAVWRRLPRPRLRRAALRELRRIEQSAGTDAATLARGLEDLLRRYAVARYGREPVARLSGQAWIDFVAAHGGVALAGEAGSAFLRAAYGGSGGAERERWLSAARGFLRGRS